MLEVGNLHLTFREYPDRAPKADPEFSIPADHKSHLYQDDISISAALALIHVRPSRALLSRASPANLPSLATDDVRGGRKLIILIFWIPLISIALAIFRRSKRDDLFFLDILFPPPAAAKFEQLNSSTRDKLQSAAEYFQPVAGLCSISFFLA